VHGCLTDRQSNVALGAASAPSASSRAFNSGVCNALPISALSRAITAGGVRAGHDDLDLPAHHVRHGRRGAAAGEVADVGLRAQLEILHRDVRGAAVAAGGVAQRAGLRLRQRDQLRAVARGNRGIDDQHVGHPLEQLALSPQCGFSSTVHGNAIAMEAQAAKLRLIVDVAREVWGEG
jgi:hypothetical protein